MITKLLRTVLRQFGLELVSAHSKSNKQIFSINGSYQIEFKNIKIDSNEYFVPKYSLHRPAVSDLLNGELYEPKTHKFVEIFCSSFNGSIIHAGTFFGDMLPNFSKFVRGNVYAFEPVLENFVLAKLTIEKNQLSNVILTNSALSSSFGNLRINTTQNDGKHAGGSSKIDYLGEICSSLTIDFINRDDIVLIQLDVEGHELSALKGAEETIKKCRPVIAIEDNNKNCSNFFKKHEYDFTREIPGLEIWVPKEQEEIRQFITNINFN